jgi:hypothetical protein
MPRVTPLGQLVDHGAPGLVFGNRGCLHEASGQIRRSHVGKRWIACRLEFKGRRRQLMQPGRYTELFFLDEATALAAGHRPCAECRREDFVSFRERWGPARADEIDARLHAERIGDARFHEASYDDLPQGTFVLIEGEPWLVHDTALRHWTPAGYDRAMPRPGGGTATVVTPRSLVAILRTHWSSSLPLIHPTAGAAGVVPAG